jgi:hypothetical protein
MASQYLIVHCANIEVPIVINKLVDKFVRKINLN